MVNVELHHVGLVLVGGIFKSVFQVEIALLKVGCELAILNIKLATLAVNKSIFVGVDASDSDGEGAVLFFERTGVQNVNLFLLQAILNESQICRG